MFSFSDLLEGVRAGCVCALNDFCSERHRYNPETESAITRNCQSNVATSRIEKCLYFNTCTARNQ